MRGGYLSVCTFISEVDVKVVEGLFMKSKTTFFFFRGLGLDSENSAGREGSVGERA